MECNIDPIDELREKAEVLITAAYDFWKAHKKLSGPRAVIWLKDNDGRLVVFTRGEYKDVIMKAIHPKSDETFL